MRETIRILLVDDNKMTRDGLAALLKQEQDMVVVGEAPNGQIAVELAQSLHPDVVIMDVRMPVLNGIQATRMICLEYPEIKVIGFTMDSETDLYAAIKNAGAVACISKTDSIDILIDTIRNCCLS